MDFKLWHRISAAAVFLISSVVFLMTVAPTLSFWDCGEFITSAVTMAVPHPPGAPFFQLAGRFFSLLPTAADMGMRVNLISTFSSSLTVLFTYLVIMRLLRMFHGDPTTTTGALVMFLSAATGGFILAFSDTFWFNASESEVYAIGMFFISSTVWLGLEWYAKAGKFKSYSTLLLIAYLMGLSIGVHLLSLLALFFVFFLVFLRDRRKDEMSIRNWAIFLVLMFAGFAVVYPGVVKYIPSLLTSAVGTIFLIAIVGGLVWLVIAKTMKPAVRIGALGVLLVALGYSTYALVVIRANQQPALNENDPKTLDGLYSYLNREQYGTYPLLRGNNYDDALRNINMEKEKVLPRRWNPESVQAYSKYSSDFDFFMSYQFGHIYLRYFLWNFVGRAGDVQDAPVVLAGNADEHNDWSESSGYPNTYFAIPLLLGLLGGWYNFRKDWKTGLAMGALFVITGIGLVVYFNMAEPQVRERDYFFVGSFYAFAIWAGLGVYALWDMVRAKAGNREAVGLAIAGIALVVAPGRMLQQNYQTHDRHYNYVAFDYAYNLLQSCDKDAILFTGGDNDTFPVWYLQYVAGVRRDVRLVNLSLVNTPWYAKQLKNERPYGALPVKLKYTDAEIEAMRPAAWESQVVKIPVNPKTMDLSSLADVPYVKSVAEVPNEIAFTLNPPFTDPMGNKGLRNQDMLILDILEQNISTRPIYFALSVAPQDRCGLDDHMIVEGLASRVTPYTFPQRGDRYYPAMNVGIIKKHLMASRTTADSGRAYGFMFRELNNPRINLDEASTRMIMSFRYLFMGLSQVVYQDGNDKQGASALLARMNEVMPQELHEMDITLKTDLSTMYFMFGDKKALAAVAPELEKYYLGKLQEDITGRNTVRSPYSVLLNVYEGLEQYQKGVELLQKFVSSYPNDQGALRQLESWKNYARGIKPKPDTVAANPEQPAQQPAQ